MSFLSRLFRSSPDPRESMRPLWHRVVEISRDPRWYEKDGVADTVPGRFDMIAAVLSLVLIRMEREADLAQQSVWLTELFVKDMDGQLRESGVGDMVVGKHMGRLMSVLGGRLGAYRTALDSEEEGLLSEAVRRNVTLVEGAEPSALASDLRQLSGVLDGTESTALLAGDIEW